MTCIAEKACRLEGDDGYLLLQTLAASSISLSEAQAKKSRSTSKHIWFFFWGGGGLAERMRIAVTTKARVDFEVLQCFNQRGYTARCALRAQSGHNVV